MGRIINKYLLNRLFERTNKNFQKLFIKIFRFFSIILHFPFLSRQTIKFILHSYLNRADKQIQTV